MMLLGTMLCSDALFSKETTKMDVKVGVRCHTKDGKLYVEYGVKNEGKLPLLAYDGAPGVPPDAEWPDLNGQIYISVAGDAVALKRIYSPTPPDVNVNRVFIPPLSMTAPGASRIVRFVLPLPLTERSQYTPDFPGAQYKEITASNLQLCLGCFWKTGAMEAQPLADNPKVFRLKGAHGQQTVLCASAPQTIQVRERTDPQFQRI